MLLVEFFNRHIIARNVRTTEGLPNFRRLYCKLLLKLPVKTSFPLSVWKVYMTTVVTGFAFVIDWLL